jgi:hypothetical protein
VTWRKGSSNCHGEGGGEKKEKKKKKICAPAENNILVQASELLPPTSPFYGVNPSISWHCGGYILSEKTKQENETYESLKWLQGFFLKTLKMR